MTSFNSLNSDFPVHISNSDFTDMKNPVDDNFYHDKGDTFSITAFDDANYLNSESYSYFLCPPEAQYQSKEDSNDNNYLYSNTSLSMEPTYQDLKNSHQFDSTNFSIFNLDNTEQNFKNFDPLENSPINNQSINDSNKLFQIEDNLSELNLSHNVTNDSQDFQLLVPVEEFDIHSVGTPGAPSIKEEEDPYDFNHYLEESTGVLNFHNSPDRPGTSSSSYLNSPYTDTAPNSPALLLPGSSGSSPSGYRGSQSHTTLEDRQAYLRDKNNQASREYRKRKRNKVQDLKNHVKELEDTHQQNLARKIQSERQIDVMSRAISMVWQRQGQMEK